MEENTNTKNDMNTLIGNTLRIYGKLLSNKKVLGYIFCNSLSYSGVFCFITTGSNRLNRRYLVSCCLF